MTSRALRGRAAHRARLSVETLESRDGPSSLTGLNGGDLITQLPGTPGVPLPAPGGPAPPPAAAPGQNRPPAISNFRASVGPNGQVTFTGTVSDDQAVAGLVVTITGTGFAATAVVDSDGTFRVTTMVFGTGEMTATATVTDALGATSDPARTTFTPMP
jgi:hypothetical protein